MPQTPHLDLLPPLSPQPTKAAQTRHALLQAALEELAEAGPERLSLRQVAKAAAVSPMASYRYFESKEVLLAQLARLGFVTLDQKVRQAAPPDFSALKLDDYRAMCHAYADFAAAHTPIYRLMFSGIIPDHANHPELMHDAKASFNVVYQAAKILRDRGVFQQIPAMHLAYHCWSFLHGFVTLNLDHAMLLEPETTIKQALNAQLDIMLKGFLV